MSYIFWKLCLLAWNRLSCSNFSASYEASEFCWQFAPRLLQHPRLCHIYMQWPASTDLCWWSLGGGWPGCLMGCGSTFVNFLLLFFSQIWRTRLYWLIQVCNRCLDLNNVDVAVWIDIGLQFLEKDSAPPFPPASPISSSLGRNIKREIFLRSPPSLYRLVFDLKELTGLGSVSPPSRMKFVLALDLSGVENTCQPCGEEKS